MKKFKQVVRKIWTKIKNTWNNTFYSVSTNVISIDVEAEMRNIEEQLGFLRG